MTGDGNNIIDANVDDMQKTMQRLIADSAEK